MPSAAKKNPPQQPAAGPASVRVDRAPVPPPAVMARPVASKAANYSFWKARYSWVIPAALVLAALLPVSGRAFHIDDTLFLFAGKHIVERPFDPYGFSLNWDDYELPMSQITKNPPLSCYYIALVGAFAGWSERALHVGFLLPALAVVLLTFCLARRLTRAPLLAALIVVAAPVYLVSAANVMCDTMLLAIWLLALVFWVEGLDAQKSILLASSGALMAAAAVTKYFGVALIPLLLAYSIYRQRRLGRWVFYFLIPVALLLAYQVWTASLYGDGLVFDAARYANSQKGNHGIAAGTLEGLSFLGGCLFPAVAFAPWLWSRREMLVALMGSLAVALVCPPLAERLAALGSRGAWRPVVVEAFHAHPLLFTLELTLYVTGGISVLALAGSDFRREKDSNSLLLLLWVFGTFVFTCYLNWTINARSILPLVPAGAILIARRVADRAPQLQPRQLLRTAAPLLVSAAIAIWVLVGDTQLANSARAAAYQARKLTPPQGSNLWFLGHWGLQYYMQEVGARPADRLRPAMAPGDYLLVPVNNVPSTVQVSAAIPLETLEFPCPSGATTMNRAVGAGFYSLYGGPLPFFLGPVPAERYSLLHFVEGQSSQ